ASVFAAKPPLRQWPARSRSVNRAAFRGHLSAGRVNTRRHCWAPKGELMSKSTLPGVGSPLRLSPVTNLERMYALDEAWNARDWETFDAYHDQSDVVVYWPGREKTPTRGGPDHRGESERFCAAFPDNKVKHPY